MDIKGLITDFYDECNLYVIVPILSFVLLITIGYTWYNNKTTSTSSKSTNNKRKLSTLSNRKQQQQQEKKQTVLPDKVMMINMIINETFNNFYI